MLPRHEKTSLDVGHPVPMNSSVSLLLAPQVVTVSRPPRVTLAPRSRAYTIFSPEGIPITDVKPEEAAQTLARAAGCSTPVAAGAVPIVPLIRITVMPAPQGPVPGMGVLLADPPTRLATALMLPVADRDREPDSEAAAGGDKAAEAEAEGGAPVLEGDGHVKSVWLAVGE